MVPHGTVEEALIEAYNLLDAEQPILAVAGRPDEAKGEALVILATMDLELDDVREKLSAAGLTYLWIPKEIKRVEVIPTLATGKLDLRKLQDLASES
jgi:acyl-[acyl-carrier-protein]-phospholipid O-acyltransferase/long-chain-fatty-acid--[acyl-carrier-protein] ligase